MQKTRPREVKKYVKDLRMFRFFTKEGCLLHLFMNNMLSNVVLSELTRNNTKETKTSRRYICIQMHKYLPAHFYKHEQNTCYGQDAPFTGAVFLIRLKSIPFIAQYHLK